MKHGAGFSCLTFTLLGLSAPAFAQGAAPGSNLQAGGLKPPDAVQSDPATTAPSQTEAQLDLADKEDSGRGLEFVYLNPEVGASYLGLHTLKDKGLVDGTQAKSKGAGVLFGAGVGVRMLAFTLGARFRFASFSDWQLWTLGAEGGFHIPLGRLEPYFTVGAGYASLGGFDSAKLGVAPRAHGLDVRGGVGLDYYLTNTFSVGANLSGEVLFLSRTAKSVDATTPASFYGTDGSGIGAGATLSAVLGLHF